MNFSERIKNRRKQLGYRMQDLAELSDISIRTIRSMEKGSYKGKLENWLTILDKLGLEFEIKVRPISYEKREREI